MEASSALVTTVRPEVAAFSPSNTSLACPAMSARLAADLDVDGSVFLACLKVSKTRFRAIVRSSFDLLIDFIRHAFHCRQHRGEVAVAVIQLDIP
jgi:hypothetical protein